jgi:murein DD-endopeptidase MepM/ murein hydrolase activator NlpD
MRLDLRSRLAREQGQPAQRRVHGLPMHLALLRGVIAAACVAGAQGAAAQAFHDAAPFAPVTAEATDLVDVPFFNVARTTWGSLRAGAVQPADTAPESRAARASTGADFVGPVARPDACTTYRVLCEAARIAIERVYAARLDYRVTPSLPAAGEQETSGERPVGLAAAEPFLFVEPESGTRVGTITGSLRASLAEADLPSGVEAQIVRLLAGRVDPKQRAWTGDYFRVTFDTDDAGAGRGSPRVTALEIRFRGQDIAGVWFAADSHSRGDYYDFDGVPLTGTRFAMPVHATRTSSSFGARTHPVTGVHHGHTGVDLAAPTGQAVHASERGTVTFIGTEPRGYGKYVVVRHDGGYASYYAHLSAFDPALRVGARVVRGQRVGAVGSTGTATGPHLHFEVRQNNRPVDPVVLMQAANASVLKGARRVAFDRVAGAARTRLAAASWSSPVALSHSMAVPAG